VIGYSLVIPCYNEARNLPLLLARTGEVLDRPDIELVLVDNGSSDDSPAVLQDLLPRYPFARVVRVDVNQGYGFGILSGLRAAQGRVLGWTHADMQTDPADALAGFALFDGSADPEQLFVKGRRQQRPLGDVVFTAGMGVFETLLLRERLWDINAQPTLFGRGFFQTWANPPNDFSLDLYAFYMAKCQGLEVKRFPVLFGNRAHGASHWNIDWKAKVKFIGRTLDYSFRLRSTLNQP
jgi:glycosyltransferase involved in cell wall biosynthesis